MRRHALHSIEVRRNRSPARRAKKCPLRERARIPVKEVSHELRVQNKTRRHCAQRSIFDIDIVRAALRARCMRAAQLPCAVAGSSKK
ncbi:hypothetical protein BSIN_4785 [Burkholderia singularis]|uniref:Uncharacterized protein n=1 Tax=Burkholderia singularis TaxID=1503053 RepID=A0A238HAD3_9BURK|nr:hypothetical protein BSIN_4785 [Burkholderia singularis]